MGWCWCLDACREYIFIAGCCIWMINDKITVAPLLSPVQEVSSSSSEITIEMHMHDGPEVGHYMGDNLKWHTSVPSCICISIVISLGELLTSWTREKSGATVIISNWNHIETNAFNTFWYLPMQGEHKMETLFFSKILYLIYTWVIHSQYETLAFLVEHSKWKSHCREEAVLAPW